MCIGLWSLGPGSPSQSDPTDLRPPGRWQTAPMGLHLKERKKKLRHVFELNSMNSIVIAAENILWFSNCFISATVLLIFEKDFFFLHYTWNLRFCNWFCLFPHNDTHTPCWTGDVCWQGLNLRFLTKTKGLTSRKKLSRAAIQVLQLNYLAVPQVFFGRDKRILFHKHQH